MVSSPTGAAAALLGIHPLFMSDGYKLDLKRIGFGVKG